MTAIPKQKAYRDRNLLRMARGREPVVQCFMTDRDFEETTVAAHPNGCIFGKGMSIKAHDFLVIYIGFNAHSWLDQSGATRQQKESFYWYALEHQMKLYKKIIYHPFESEIATKSAKNAIKAFSDWVTENAWRFAPGDWKLEYVKEVV